MALVARPGFLLAASHVAMAAHVFALVAGVLVLVWVIHFGGGAALHSDNKDLVFNVHPLVMCLGFILVAGEGIMAYKTVPAVRRVQKIVHLTLHFIALTLGIFGVYTAFKYHRETQTPDMYTLHSWIGMVTICLFGLQWLFGFVYFWYPKAPLPTRTMVAPFHAAAGIAVFLMAICTAETGLVEKEAAAGTGPGVESRVINFTGLFLLLFGVTVSLTTALPKLTTL